uniref:Uncharacterized protein n=1 Tax=Anopheles minimus TaxID=112268 RepID=A0A182WMX3_9DIPT
MKRRKNANTNNVLFSQSYLATSSCSKVPSPAGYRCRSASIWTRLAGPSCVSCRSVIMTR